MKRLLAILLMPWWQITAYSAAPVAATIGTQMALRRVHVRVAPNQKRWIKAKLPLLSPYFFSTCTVSTTTTFAASCSDGDDVVLANGAVLTISGTATLGSDAGTSAISCSPSTGTGVFSIAAGATVTIRGHIDPCNDTNVGAGVALIHSAATNNYLWRQRATKTLFLNGASGSHITLSKAAGSVNFGGFKGSSLTAADSGLMQARYVDLADCGTTNSTGYCIYSQPTNAVTVSLDHITATNSSKVSVGNPGAAATWSVTNSRLGLGTNLDTSGYVLEFGSNGTAVYPNTAKTTGTRRIRGNYLYGVTFLGSYTPSLSGAFDPGLEFSYNALYFNTSGGTKSALEVSSSTGPLKCSNCQYDLIANINSQVPVSTIPQGDLRDWIFLKAAASGATQPCSGTTNHQPTKAIGPTNIIDAVSEIWTGTGQNWHFYAIPVSSWAGTGSTTDWPVVVSGLVVPPGCDGKSGSVLLAGYGTSPSVPWACATTDLCPTLEVHHSTFVATFKAAGGAAGQGGAASETIGYAGRFVGLHDSIAYNPTSANGALTGSSVTSTLADGFFSGRFGWNATYNMTVPPAGNGMDGSTYYDLLGTFPSKYTALGGTTIGQGDQAINPQFADPTYRTFLKYCQTLNGADATWMDCLGHLADGTYAAETFTAAAWAWIRAGYYTSSTTSWSMSSSGGYVGATRPPSIFPLPGNMLGAR